MIIVLDLNSCFLLLLSLLLLKKPQTVKTLIKDNEEDKKDVSEHLPDKELIPVQLITTFPPAVLL